MDRDASFFLADLPRGGPVWRSHRRPNAADHGWTGHSGFRAPWWYRARILYGPGPFPVRVVHLRARGEPARTLAVLAFDLERLVALGVARREHGEEWTARFVRTPDGALVMRLRASLPGLVLGCFAPEPK